jgi:hypothetical protein
LVEHAIGHALVNPLSAPLLSPSGTPMDLPLERPSSTPLEALSLFPYLFTNSGLFIVIEDIANVERTVGPALVKSFECTVIESVG